MVLQFSWQDRKDECRGVTAVLSIGRYCLTSTSSLFDNYVDGTSSDELMLCQYTSITSLLLAPSNPAHQKLSILNLQSYTFWSLLHGEVSIASFSFPTYPKYFRTYYMKRTGLSGLSMTSTRMYATIQRLPSYDERVSTEGLRRLRHPAGYCVRLTVRVQCNYC